MNDLKLPWLMEVTIVIRGWERDLTEQEIITLFPEHGKIMASATSGKEASLTLSYKTTETLRQTVYAKTEAGALEQAYSLGQTYALGNYKDFESITVRQLGIIAEADVQEPPEVEPFEPKCDACGEPLTSSTSIYCDGCQEEADIAGM